jgi:methylthioribose-1-phosphate isomerase
VILDSEMLAPIRSVEVRDATLPSGPRMSACCAVGRRAFWGNCGTAPAPIYMGHDLGFPIHVWVDETRPRNQGASLMAWELAHHGNRCSVPTFRMMA